MSIKNTLVLLAHETKTEFIKTINCTEPQQLLQKIVVQQITDASGRVIWMVPNAGPIVLEVWKITFDTYAAETTYMCKQFAARLP